MAFDLTTARPVAQSGKFNLATAKPVTPTGYLPTVQDWMRSGTEYLANTAQAVLHPIQTAKGLGNVALGTAQKLLPGQQAQEPYADAVGQFILQRYGSVDKALDTLKHDPVGTLADASAILSGGASLAARAPRYATMARALGTTARVIDPLTVTTKAVGMAGRALSTPQQVTAGRLVNQLIKPSNRQFSYGRNPGLAVAQEGIVATNLTELATKVAQRRQQVGQQIGQALVIPSIASQRLNVATVLDPITEALTKAQQAPRTNRALIRRLENLRKDLLGVTFDPQTGQQVVTRNLTTVSPTEAFALKTEIGELTQWTDNLTEDTLVNAALKKSYQKVREQLEYAVPGIKSLNTRYGNLLEAENATRRQALAAERASRPAWLDAVIGSAGAGIGGFYGRSPTAAVSGAILSIGARHLVNSPLFRTGMAVFLEKSSPAEIAALFRRVPGLQSELVRVGMLAGTGQQRLQDATGSTQ